MITVIRSGSLGTAHLGKVFWDRFLFYLHVGVAEAPFFVCSVHNFLQISKQNAKAHVPTVGVALIT